MPAPTLHNLLARVLGAPRAARLLETVDVAPALLRMEGLRVPRALAAQALNLLLFEDLVARVPAAQAYVRERVAQGGKVRHDHGALRTVALAGMGALPPGAAAFARILVPLGYAQRDEYPLPRLKMTGRAWAQQDFPEDIAQFFVSELHPEKFSPAFQDAVARVTADSRDPLTPAAREALRALEVDGAIDLDDAALMLPVLARCFERQHPLPAVSDYETLLAESPEMAWISTEGNAFNHATDRVEDVEALAREQKRLGRPMKDAVEVSRSGRVRQTAFRAAMVRRALRGADGGTVEREVPGSFYEFITRDPLPGGGLDLSFDSGNAQGIFKMTEQMA